MIYQELGGGNQLGEKNWCKRSQGHKPDRAVIALAFMQVVDKVVMCFEVWTPGGNYPTRLKPMIKNLVSDCNADVGWTEVILSSLYENCKTRGDVDLQEWSDEVEVWNDRLKEEKFECQRQENWSWEVWLVCRETVVGRQHRKL